MEDGRALALELRNEDHVDFVFALTHMRLPSDERLAREVPEIDIIMGGHDHTYVVKKVNSTWIVKSGTDFRDLTKVELKIGADKKFDLAWEHVEVTRQIPADENAVALVTEYGKLVAGKKLNKILGKIKTPLDGRFQIIRTEESNLSNWIADVVRDTMRADVCIINSGKILSLFFLSSFVNLFSSFN